MVVSSQFTSFHAIVDGLDTHYTCLGEGPPVILLHGDGGDWRDWLDSLPILARHFRVIALDMPGFGLSKPPGIPVSPRWYGSFLKSFMETLGIPAACIIGHSLGGASALALAIDSPGKVNKMVIIDSAGLGHLSWTGRALHYLFRVLGSVTGKNRHYAPGGEPEDWLMGSHLQTIGMPVLIVWGGRDPYFPLSQAKRAQELIPNCRLHVFQCVCHAPQREFPDEFHQIVHQFLTG